MTLPTIEVKYDLEWNGVNVEWLTPYPPEGVYSLLPGDGWHTIWDCGKQWPVECDGVNHSALCRPLVVRLGDTT